MRILVVEDETGISGFLQTGLAEEGYVVETADDGEVGLAMALSGHYDLLLLDWMLPGLDGLELCKEFRKRNPSTPVVFLTVRDSEKDIKAGLTAGANDYIRKPFAFDDLLVRIERQLGPNASRTV